LALQLGRTPDELRQTLTYADKVEIAAWCRINGPLPILRHDFHAALIALLIHNQNLTEKTRHHAKKLPDFLLWGNKPESIESDLRRAMSEMGVELRPGKPTDV
jgi:hypothetical protein